MVFFVVLNVQETIQKFKKNIKKHVYGNMEQIIHQKIKQ